MYIASVSVASPGPPPVIAYGMSKVCTAVMVRKMSATKIAGRSIGSVISTNCCQVLAPSTSAASYSDFGIACSPASSISAMNDDAFQMIAMQIAQNASVGSDSHCGGSMPSFTSQS